MSGKLLFYYLGDDEAYFRALQGEFRRHLRVNFDFQRLFESEEKKIQSLFLKIFKDKPNCVFVDFSKHTQDYLHLARLVSRTPMEHEMVMTGLVDYLSPPEVLRESVATGTNLNFIKSAETFDVIFATAKIIASQGIAEHGFATASLKEDLEAGVLCKIGYIEETGLHIETDHKLDKGERIRFNHHWMEKRIVPSREVFVKNVSTSNMFYQFKYNADLDFLFIDEFIPPEGMEEKQIEEKKSEREELIIYHKKQLKKWIDDNLSRSQEKRAKVLIVDRNFRFFQNQPRTDKHSYTIRCIPFFTDVGVELDRLRPQVIAMEFEDPEKTDDPKNTPDSLLKLIKVLKSKLEDVTPFIVVFNSKTSSKEMQDNYSYPQIISHPGELSVEVLLKMADIFEKKLGHLQLQSHPGRVYIRKNNLASVGEILKQVTVVKLSESDMILQSEFPFPEGTNIHLTEPVDMFVNVRAAPAKPGGNSKIPEFYGLIHSLGETEKKELRKYVNSVFFRDHDAQVQAEADEFKKLNDLKLQQKIEVTKKLEEAAQKEKEEKEQEEKEKEEASQIPENADES